MHSIWRGLCRKKKLSYRTENQFSSRQFVQFKNQYVLFFIHKKNWGDNLEKKYYDIAGPHIFS